MTCWGLGLGRGFGARAIGARLGLTALAFDLAEALCEVLVMGPATGFAGLATLPFGADESGGWELVPCEAG